MASISFMSFLRPLPLPRTASIYSLQRRLLTQPHHEQASANSSNAATFSSYTPASSLTVQSLPAKSPPPLAYHVHRTASQQLPIYHLAKRGGNLHQTRIRKIEGDVELLRNEIRTALGLDEGVVVINRLTGHIIIKGWYRDRIKKFLEDRQF